MYMLLKKDHDPRLLTYLTMVDRFIRCVER